MKERIVTGCNDKGPVQEPRKFGCPGSSPECLSTPVDTGKALLSLHFPPCNQEIAPSETEHPPGIAADPMAARDLPQAFRPHDHQIAFLRGIDKDIGIFPVRD